MPAKKLVFRLFALFVIAATLLSACGGQAAPVTSGGVVASVPQDLIIGCKAEGILTLIATPVSKANYGEIFELLDLLHK